MIEQVICPNPDCKGHGFYTLGPYPASPCNTCGGKGYIMAEVKSKPVYEKALEKAREFIKKCNEESVNQGGLPNALPFNSHTLADLLIEFYNEVKE